MSQPNDADDGDRLESVGARRVWADELRRGVRGQRVDQPSTWEYGPLWRAACYEARAWDEWRLGMRASARTTMRQAAEIIATAYSEAAA